MRVNLLIFGTRGDVQPAVALGVQLLDLKQGDQDLADWTR
jgi:UDP:flavonoid glycosyltransferase YjiC (YdhE family)